jgi:hypothetical protein
MGTNASTGDSPRKSHARSVRGSASLRCSATNAFSIDSVARMAIRRRANVVKSIGGKVIELIFGSIIADMVRAGGWWVGRAMIELARWEVEER